MTEQICERLGKAKTCCTEFLASIRVYPIEIPEKGILAGFCTPRETRISSGEDNVHFPMNLDTLMTRGFFGIAADARANARILDGEEANYLRCIATCHEAAMDFAAAHADKAEEMASSSHTGDSDRLHLMANRCRALRSRAPRSLREAMQLFWFAWNIRGRGTIGRLDQYLYPFYKADTASDGVTRETVLADLSDLFESLNISGTGDTLRNLMLGGQDRKGKDATNELSYLMVDAALAVRKPEPHLCVRLHMKTPPSFRDKVSELHALGHGQGAIYNDEMIIPSLVAKGVPLASARNYANDGCTEIVIDGESGIAFTQLEAVKSLELSLFSGQEAPRPGAAVGRYHRRMDELRPLKTALRLGHDSGSFAQMTCFEEVYTAFLDQYLYQLDLRMQRLCDVIRHQQENGVSAPFMAGTFPATLAKGMDPFRGGFTVPCYMVFSGSIPTAADCLMAIKSVVFEDKRCTPAQMLEALKDNFEGHETLRQYCLAAPKFGNDDDRVDLIAADIAGRFCERVVSHPTPTGKPLWPALYNFLFNDYAKILGATPDGRKWNDPIAEHYSPTPGRALNGPTSVIRSAAKGPLGEACGTSIFHVSLSRSMIDSSEQGRRVLRGLLDGALKQGTAVMDIAIYDVQQMREAQRHPERHRDMIVRVWGFCARFVDLSCDMQEHIVQRALVDGA